MQTIENVVVFEDHKHHIFRGNNDYLVFYVTTGTKIIRVQSYLGDINPFCCYSFKGKYIKDTVFLAKQCSFKPSKPNFLLLKKIVSVMSKREKQFPVRRWLSMIHDMDNTDFEKDLLPIILSYAEKHTDLAFFCFPDIYSFVQDYYENNKVLLWPLNVCRTLQKMIMEDPYDLTFTSPFPEMVGSVLCIERLQEILPETPENKRRYDECRSAEFFCFNPVRSQDKSTFNQEILHQLIAKDFLCVDGEKVMLKRTYDMYKKVKQMRFLPHSSNQDIHTWCSQNPDFNYIASKHWLLDATFPFSYEIDDNKQNCLLNIELWTLSDIETVLNGRQPTMLYGVGLPTAKGNRAGYNVFHLSDAFGTTIPTVIPKNISLDSLKTKGECLFLKVGNNIFHSEIIQTIREAYPETRGRKLTFTTTTPIDEVPYEFKKSIKDINNHVFSPQDRIILNRHHCRRIQKVLLDTTKVEKKRKRRTHCQSTNAYKPNKKIVIDFKNGESIDFKSIEQNMSHWGLMDYNRILGLREDVIVLLTADVDKMVVRSLMNCCKKLIVVYTKNSLTSDMSSWGLTDFQ